MLTCPNCHSDNLIIIDSRNNKTDTIYLKRRRQCQNCNNRFTTIEISIEDYEAILDENKKLHEDHKRFYFTYE